MNASGKAFRTLVENGSKETNMKKKMLSQRRVRSARRMPWYMMW
jgi:hypothetical protein